LDAEEHAERAQRLATANAMRERERVEGRDPTGIGANDIPG
jgi:hypothetical protein